MRVGFDAKRLFNNFTGLGNYSRFVVDAVAACFPENEYWLYAPKWKQHPETMHYLESGKFTIKKPETTFYKKFSAVWRSYALGNIAAADGVTIFHGLSNELPLSKPSGLKTVVTVHDLIFRRFPAYYNPIDVQIYSWKLKKACASADSVVAISQQTASDLQEFMLVPKERIRVIYQGCHPNFKQPATEQQKANVRKKYQLPSEFLLFVGTLEERKNAILIVKALRLLKEKAQVVLVGKPTPYLTKLRQLIHELHLENQVHVLHQVSFTDLPAIYQSATLFLYPSLFEGFGIPIIEAIASGVPVITSKGSCFNEAGGPATRYINPTDPEELGNTIDELLASESLRVDMVKRSNEYIARFEPNVIATNMMGVYRELV